MILRGWKKIEKFLKLSRHTIKKKGFPIYYIGLNSSVYADTKELRNHHQALLQKVDDG